MSSRKKTSHSKSSSSKRWQVINGGVTAPQGYLAAGVASGIKKRGLDLAILLSTQPASAAAVFTQNQVKAAPVVLSKKHLKLSRGRARAIVINSGCANACTGEKGMKDAINSAKRLASCLEVDPTQVLVESTGVIGSHLPMHKVLKGISAAVAAASSQGGIEAARAIMTTDTCEKTAAIQMQFDGKIIRIGGMAKGAGMIHPQLATMIAVITTVLRVSPVILKGLLQRVVDRTFNCITVDGDTSTNDMVLVMANGASGASLDKRSAPLFEKGLTIISEELAKSIARDGEGATKFVEILVRGGETFEAARQVAKAIANSSLVKTAIFGEELNWGRILCAAGYSGIPFDPERVKLSLNGIPVYHQGAPVSSNRARAEKAMKAHDLKFEVDLAPGGSAATVWTCDLGRGYVDINASYIT